LLLFVLFIVEGTIVPWLIPGSWQTRLFPHLVFVCIMFFSIYENRYSGLILGLLFGLLHDVVFYGALIGAYSFAMGFTGYLVGVPSKSRPIPLPMMLICIISGSLLLDSTLFGIYSLFELTHQSYSWALVNHIIPNLFVQFVFALIIYVPLRRQLEIIMKRRSPDKKS
jgi:rod shape-determining protein MreD